MADALVDVEAVPEWAITWPAANPATRTGVRRYVAWREDVDHVIARREVPSGGIALILSFGPTMRVSNPAAGATTVSSFVVGMYTEPALTEHDGQAGGVQVDLSPAAAYALVAAPMDELTNRVAPVGDLGTLDVDRLIDRMLECSAWPERFAVLDDELGAAITRGPRMSPEVAWANARLRATPATRVAALAGELGWSRARMVDRFRREVGVPPKVLARIARFRDACTRLTAAAPSPSFARVAFECGYADQSHFNREFRELAGCTPTEFVAAEFAL